MPPLPPQSIALHIGAHKTASTHLQKVLHQNRAMLANEGIRFFGPGYLRMRGRSLAAMFGLSWSDSPMPRRTPQEQLAFLANGSKRLVFSEENFVGVLSNKKGRVGLPLYPSGVDRVAELAASWAPLKPQLFLAVRSPASYIASAYSQSLFGAPNVGPRTFRARNDWRKVDWADYVARLRAIRDVGDVFVWRQEDYEHSHRLILRRMLRWKVGGKIETLDRRIHQSLSAAAVRQTLSWAQEGRSGKLAEMARSAFPINEENKRFELYSAATLAQAQEVYAAQMAQIDAMDGVSVLHPPAAVLKG